MSMSHHVLTRRNERSRSVVCVSVEHSKSAVPFLIATIAMITMIYEIKLFSLFLSLFVGVGYCCWWLLFSIPHIGVDIVSTVIGILAVIIMDMTKFHLYLIMQQGKSYGGMQTCDLTWFGTCHHQWMIGIRVTHIIPSWHCRGIHVVVRDRTTSSR